MALKIGDRRHPGRIFLCHSGDAARAVPCLLFDEQRRPRPQDFFDVHPRFHTPYRSNMLFFVFTGLFAAFIPEDIVGEMTSIGTLFAFVMVCIGVWILRRRSPDLPRAFRVPAVPFVSTAGVIVCGAMIYGLGWTNWLRLFVWLVIGLVVYFTYGCKHSKVQALESGSK